MSNNNNNNNNFAYKFEATETEYISNKIKNINKITNKYNLYKENNLYHHELIQDTISSKYKIDILPNGRINLDKDKDKDNEQLLHNLLVDTQRVTYNVLIVYNKKYFQLNNNYLTQMNIDNFEKLMYELFLEFIGIKQYGGDQKRKKEAKLRRTKRKSGYRQEKLERKREQERKQQEQELKQKQKEIIKELKNKFEKRKEKQEQNKIKQNKFISMFYLLIFQALKAEFTNYFVLKMKPSTFIFDKYQTLKTCIIDYDNYIITYYQPFLCLNKENYYITYIFSKAYFDDNNNIKIDTFTYPFNKNMNNRKLFNDLAFITNYSILEVKNESINLFDGNIDEDKNIILSEDEQQMQMSFEHMNNSRTSTSNISNIYTQQYNSRSYYPQQDIENRNIFYNKIVLLNI